MVRSAKRQKDIISKCLGKDEMESLIDEFTVVPYFLEYELTTVVSTNDVVLFSLLSSLSRSLLAVTSW